jgi:hypothetical protein
MWRKENTKGIDLSTHPVLPILCRSYRQDSSHAQGEWAIQADLLQRKEIGLRIKKAEFECQSHHTASCSICEATNTGRIKCLVYISYFNTETAQLTENMQQGGRRGTIHFLPLQSQSTPSYLHELVMMLMDNQSIFLTLPPPPWQTLVL